MTRNINTTKITIHVSVDFIGALVCLNRWHLHKMTMNFKLSNWTFCRQSSYQGSTWHCIKCVHIWSFSGLYFLVFGLNTEIYKVNIRIQSKYKKIRTRKTPNAGTFDTLWRGKLVYQTQPFQDIFTNSKLLY